MTIPSSTDYIPLDLIKFPSTALFGFISGASASNALKLIKEGNKPGALKFTAIAAAAGTLTVYGTYLSLHRTTANNLQGRITSTKQNPMGNRWVFARH